MRESGNQAAPIKFSIIVPVYNDAAYLPDCLDSLVSQTLSEIEILLINDGSTDTSPQIMREYAARDSRVKVISLPENRGAFQARNAGIRCASGEYILFVDADDYIALDACERLWTLEQEQPVDILNFAASVTLHDATPHGAGKPLDRYAQSLAPPEGYLYGEEIFTLFLSRNLEGHICLRTFPREFCLKVLSQCEDLCLVRSEDKYFYWIACCLANSYRGCPSAILYHYRRGLGDEGSVSLIDLPKFESFCKLARTENAIETFSRKSPLRISDDAIEQSRSASVKHCIQYFQYLLHEKKPAGLRMLLAYWDRPGDAGKIAGAFCQIFQNRRDELSGLLAVCFHDTRPPAKTIQTIGTYFPSYYGDQCKGGIHRVMSMLMPLWVRMGYRVVLFTDMANGEDTNGTDMRCPAGVIRVRCTPPARQSANDYARRGMEMERLLREYAIDVMVYQDYANPSLLWEILLCRLMGIPFLTYYHSVFTKFLIMHDSRFYQIPYVARCGNAIVVLSEMDRKFWECAAPDTQIFQVVNPPVFAPDSVQPSILTEPHIVWVGRLDETVKHFFDPVDIMREVVRQIPEAKLYLVGGDDGGANFQRLQKKVVEMGLEQSVLLCGFQKDVAPYYQSASVFLMTSAYEGFPMVLTEALAFGLPVVMYDLPYLTLVRGNKGVVSVPQRDIRAAAEEICKLLKDRACRRETGRQGREFLQNLHDGDKVAEQWRNIFDSIGRPAAEAPESETDQLLVQTLLDHYHLLQPQVKRPTVRRIEDAFLLAIDCVDQRLKDACLSVEVHLLPEYEGKFDFAWYLERSSETIRKVRYQPENKYEFSDLEAGTYRVKCYLRHGKLIKSFYTAPILF